MAKIAIVSHCLLNNISKVEAFKNKNKDFISYLFNNDIEVIQLPCPEFTYYGGRRFGQVKEQFDTPFYRAHCKKLIKTFLDQIEEYQRNGHHIVGIFAIKGSPSCGFKHTTSGPSWQGEISSLNEESLKDVNLVQGTGVFIEELIKNLPKDINIVEVDEENIQKTIEECKFL